MKKVRTRQLVIAGALIFILFAVMLGLLIHYATRTCSGEDIPYMETTTQPVSTTFDTIVSPLEFFNVNDALEIKWYHGTNTKQQVDAALKGDYMMLEADIILRFQGLPNQTDIPVMALPPALDSDNTLENWLDAVLAKKNKGIKMDFKSLTVVEPALRKLIQRREMVNRPVWVNADVVTGPGSTGEPIDPAMFLSTINRVFPQVTLSLGWTTGCCDEIFSDKMMEEMASVCADLTQPVTLPARAALLKRSWPQFKALLEKNDQFTITVWTVAGDTDWEGASEYDLLYVRNDCGKEKIYFDLPGPKFDVFRRLAKTAGIPAHHFDIKNMDALHITWAHAVNSQAKLKDALNGEIMMLEADIQLHGYDTVNQSNVPIMAHPPDIYSDVTFEQWLEKVLETKKGIKLDFKNVDAMEPVLKLLKDNRERLNRPVWINADILKGPNGGEPRNATRFINIVNTTFPECTLSIGWTTGWTNSDSDEIYTQTMAEEMHYNVSQDLPQPVTFPIRAAAARKSWPVLRWLLDQSRSYTLTIWHGASDNVDRNDMNYIRIHSERARVYFDLPEHLLPNI